MKLVLSIYFLPPSRIEVVVVVVVVVSVVVEVVVVEVVVVVVVVVVDWTLPSFLCLFPQRLYRKTNVYILG